MIEKRKIFITAKTYPTLSKKYDELVCTAGILDDGNWVRVYPMPFRKLEYERRYKKYQWMEFELKKNTSDPRPETYKVANISGIKNLGEPVSTKNKWQERKRIVLGNNKIYTNISELIEQANKNELSLAVFKPQNILDFVVKETDRQWPTDKLERLEAKAKQLSLFQSKEEVKKEFSVVEKLPYNFYYRFIDDEGTESKLTIIDWETGALYWNCLKSSKKDEKEALAKVRKKYFDNFLKKDIYLFLGTTQQFHGWAKNPFVIIGVFCPPYDPQLPLF